MFSTSRATERGDGRTKARAIVGVAVAAAGSWVALRAIDRPGAQTGAAVASLAGAAPGARVGPVHPADLPAWQDLRFQTLPPAEALERLGARLEQPKVWTRVGLTDADANALRSRALVRLRYVIEASEEKRLETAKAEGATRIEPPEGLTEGSKERQARWPEVWAGAPIDPEHAVVRSIDFSSDASLEPSLTPVTSRSSLSSDYGEAPPGVRTYEVVVPFKPLAAPGATSRTPAFLGLSYDRTARGEWRPRRLAVYYEAAPGGRPLVPPPL